MNKNELLYELDKDPAPSQDLDAAISIILGNGDYVDEREDGNMVRYLGCGSISSVSVRPRQYTASIQAVKSTLEGYKVQVEWGPGYGKATITNGDNDPKYYRREVEIAKTPEIALCKAAIKIKGRDKT